MQHEKKNADPFEMCHFSLIIMGRWIMYMLYGHITSVKTRLKSHQIRMTSTEYVYFFLSHSRFFGINRNHD